MTLTSSETSDYPFQKIFVDLLGPLRMTAKKERYVLSVVDAHSKWLLCTPLRQQTAENVGQALIDQVFTKFGFPEYMVSDNGRQFVGEIVQDVVKMFGIHHIRTTPYHPEGNGAVERTNRTVVTAVAAYTNRLGDDWSTHLQVVTYALNQCPHEATGVSPFKALFGREPRNLKDFMMDSGMVKTNFGEERVEGLKLIWKQMAQKQDDAKKRRAKQANCDRKTKEKPIEMGTVVLKWIDHLPVDERHKFAPHWEGPFEVTAMTRRNAQLNGEKWTHINKLKPYISRENS